MNSLETKSLLGIENAHIYIKVLPHSIKLKLANRLYFISNNFDMDIYHNSRNNITYYNTISISEVELLTTKKNVNIKASTKYRLTRSE